MVATARVMMPISASEGLINFDALLAWVVAKRLGLPPLQPGIEPEPINIPLAMEPEGRFHLASVSLGRAERINAGYIQRRSPLREFIDRGDAKLKRVHLASGSQKNSRLPIETMVMENDEVRFLAIGDIESVADLLSDVAHLGRRRGVGRGRLAPGDPWKVESFDDPWEGFPCVSRSGKALRPLPIGWPGVKLGMKRYGRLTYPYHFPDDQELLAPPSTLAEGIGED